MSRTLDSLPRGARARITRIGGERFFRRRLMEMGLVPGVEVAMRDRAPLGDPVELEVRGGRLSIRRAEARQVEIE